MPKSAETAVRERPVPVVTAAETVGVLGVKCPDIYSPKASNPVTPNTTAGKVAVRVCLAVRRPGERERRYQSRERRETPTREKIRGKVKRKPRREGKRRVGILAKRRESELASACDVAIKGNVRRSSRIAVGAARARIGSIARFIDKGAW